MIIINFNEIIMFKNCLFNADHISYENLKQLFGKSLDQDQSLKCKSSNEALRNSLHLLTVA